jgi:hypothetical protein
MATLSKIEKKILFKVADSQLITKQELRTFLQNDGMAGRDQKDVSQIVDSAAKGLIDKKLLTAISPVGSTCYIITQQGTRMLQDMKE